MANMPGAVARTSTFALTNATFPYVAEIAAKGYRRALMESAALRKGLNLYKGRITCRAVAESFQKEWIPAEEALEG